MILVDTSVWIDHGRRRSPRVAGWLTEGKVLGHPFVAGELASGTMARRAEFLALFERLPTAAVVDHREMLRFVEQHELMGLGLSWIDLHLLASALGHPATLATNDRRLAQAAHRLGLAEEP
jgi:predicted nucleic acid-binding protein